MGSNEQPPTDLWLQRSRLSGIIITAFTYGIYFILSINACVALRRNHARTPESDKPGKRRSRFLLVYVIVTFLLSSIAIGANARYTEDIWINYGALGKPSPEYMIVNEFEFWYNRLATVSSFVQIWIMDFLVLYRCCVIWNFSIWVGSFMGIILATIIGFTISVMISIHESKVFVSFQSQLGFLIVSCIYNITFTSLVVYRLMSIRKQVTSIMGEDYASMYSKLTVILVESAALYFVVEAIFLVSFALRSNVQNLVFMQYPNIQGISLLLIIVRVAQGKDNYDGQRLRVATDVESSRLEFTSCPPAESLVLATTPGAAMALETFSVPHIPCPSPELFIRGSGKDRS
ncbi:hypothetical protein PM082_022852 [Marasmius tenuissimus]|nr:hypothetical protein PM082_022852 [Marasmius tenuissimus]